MTSLEIGAATRHSVCQTLDYFVATLYTPNQSNQAPLSDTELDFPSTYVPNLQHNTIC